MLTRLRQSRRLTALAGCLLLALVAPLFLLGGFAGAGQVTKLLEQAGINLPSFTTSSESTPVATATADPTPEATACDQPGMILLNTQIDPAISGVNVPPGRPIQSLAFLDLPFPYDGGNENFGGTLGQFKRASQRSWAGGRISSFFDHLYPLYPAPSDPAVTFGREPAEAPVGQNILHFEKSIGVLNSRVNLLTVADDACVAQ